ncbi:conjugal transfer protein TraX [Pseudomonas vlassakiae]|uniref:conjugal transfer protein TraX n=1 Tax=Pseudomonas vlassakiae TaxID=485888 RepID=UPI0021C9E75A|nr:conjugal transfer protein TraX [Pseudomonas vlassakiae]MCU0123453.1 conjugal transfer protein TraX [Pseudomonas vlassakiae]
MRSAGLDLVKWVAIVTMVADHVRFIWPAAEGLFIVGRFAFPLFCLAMAVNVARAGDINLRYLGWLLAFAVLSEAPYRWLDPDSQTFSIIPTLTLGLLVAWGVHHQQVWVRLGGLAAVLLAALCSERLMYGLPGVLLPALWQGSGAMFDRDDLALIWRRILDQQPPLPLAAWTSRYLGQAGEPGH